MKIVVAGGKGEADFLIEFLLSKKFTIKVINEDADYCRYLAKKHGVNVLNGDPSKEYILEDADIIGYDVLIALANEDADNFVICQIAKKEFDVKKVVCTVTNPTNVEIFKKLGINSVISSTYSVAKLLEQATTFENLVNTLSANDEAFSVSEIIIQPNTHCVGKQIRNIKLPAKARISCVIRKGSMIIPTGQTIINEDDKVLVLSEKECHDETIRIMSEVV